ncbi:MAG: hypothetical protein JST54_05140 [Deltaproteobacteria bacterium]|nr:hypothetical protein [Deltaproteobacteria bacterium]
MLPLPLLLASWTATAEVRPAHKRVVVMDIETTGRVDPAVAKSLGLVLPEAVRKAEDKNTQVMSMGDARALVGLQTSRARLGCSSDSDCISELGGALGADEMIVGQLAQVGSTYILELRRIDVRHARVLGSAVDKVEGRPDDLVTTTETLVPQLYGAAKSNSATANAAPAPSPYPTPPPADGPTTTTTTTTTAPEPSRALPVALLVSGAVLVAGGVGCIVYSSGVHGAVDDQQPGGPNAGAPTVTRSQYQTAGTLYPVGWGAAVVGAGAAAFGIWELLQHDAPPVAMAPTPGGAMVAARGSF